MTTVLSALSEQNFGNNTRQVEAGLKKHEAIAADIEARVCLLAIIQVMYLVNPGILCGSTISGTNQVIGWEDHFRNDLYCADWNER